MRHFTASFSLLFFLSSLVLQTGCTAWPLPGSGGMAEHQRENISPILPDHPLGPEHGLRFDLELTSRHLDVLVLEGAELCFPATVIQARQRQHRIERELIGELTYDAANDLIVQRGLLARLERQLDYVTHHDLCVIADQDLISPRTSPNMSPIASIDDPAQDNLSHLLNCDNQFAFDSSEINPKYLAKLAEAAIILRDKPHLQLKISGHADHKGKPAYNKKLSLKRAHVVGRYLEIFGIEKHRLTYSAKGSSDPYIESNGSHNRLVNRRVTIKVFD